MLSTASDDDDDADSDATTELDDDDAAQFAHIRRQEVTRLQVLPRICQLCQQQQQQHQQSAAVEEWFEFRGGQQRVLDRGQIEKGQLGTQVQLCQTEGSVKVVFGGVGGSGRS